MRKCERCMEYKEPEEFSTPKVCKECMNIAASIRRYAKRLETLQPSDARYQHVKEIFDALVKTEQLYQLLGGKIPNHRGDLYKLSVAAFKAQNKELLKSKGVS